MKPSIDIESVAQDVLAAEGWNASQWERAMRLAEQIVNTPEEFFVSDGVARDLVLPLEPNDARNIRASINLL